MVVICSLEHLFDIKKKEKTVLAQRGLLICLFRMRFEDLRDKQVEEGGVGGIRRNGSIASVHEDVVPGGGRRASDGGAKKLFIFFLCFSSEIPELQYCVSY